MRLPRVLEYSACQQAPFDPLPYFLPRRNIVAFKGTGKHDDAEYLVQEYIVGGTATSDICLPSG